MVLFNVRKDDNLGEIRLSKDSDAQNEQIDQKYRHL